jgi:hypothetical protein
MTGTPLGVPAKELLFNLPPLSHAAYDLLSHSIRDSANTMQGLQKLDLLGQNSKRSVDARSL